MGNTAKDQENAWARQSAFAEQQYKVGLGVTLFEHFVSTSWRGEVNLTGFSVRTPAAEGGEWLVVLRGTDHEGGPVVAFHSALGIGEALAGASGRMQNGTLKWKPDQYRT